MISISILTFCGFSVYGRGWKLDKAVEMFNAARSSGHSPDEKAYANLISFYGKAGIVFSRLDRIPCKINYVSLNLIELWSMILFGHSVNDITMYIL